MLPIYDLIGGWVDKFKSSFKLYKARIDLRNEESNNQSQNQAGNEIRSNENKNENNNISNYKNNYPKTVPVSETYQIEMDNQINNENAKYHHPSNN